MKKIILFSAMVSAVFVAVSCNVQAVYEEDFDRDVLSSGTWTVNMSGEHSSKACFIADDGVDGNGCIMLSSADRTELYISYPLSGLDPDVLYRMTASVQTEAVKDGRGAVVSVSTDDSEQIWNASEFLYGDNGWKDVDRRPFGKAHTVDRKEDERRKRPRQKRGDKGQTQRTQDII